MKLNNGELQKGINDAEHLSKLLSHLAPETFREFMVSEFALPMPELSK
ncbi:MAG TPA: hypothetical protein VF427_00985 [Noviherbaspirillum sp.]